MTHFNNQIRYMKYIKGDHLIFKIMAKCYFYYFLSFSYRIFIFHFENIDIYDKYYKVIYLMNVRNVNSNPGFKNEKKIVCKSKLVSSEYLKAPFKYSIIFNLIYFFFKEA